MVKAAPTNGLGIDRPSVKLRAKGSGMQTIRPTTATADPSAETQFQQAATMRDLLRDMPEGSQEDLKAMAEVGAYYESGQSVV